ncbi:rod shape-determining protein MreD [Oceanobacillus massiliensis]|uniref:rod shape-determining protein MreD n=1 Tax=Oceanobacillus massiliensis TaxID=1465765 RepID=UPI00028A2920|nr:rod shape-determining protein MreD [Oceanobacillus massiliensis]
MIKRFYIPLILFLLTILEGVALELLPPDLVKNNMLIVPHWVLAFLIFVAVFYDRDNTYHSIVYGLIFGLLIDVVYTGVLGVYMFSYALVLYIVHGLTKLLQGNIYVLLLLGMLGVCLSELSIYLIYTSAGLIDMVFENYLMDRLLPTVLLNLVFILLIYPFTAKRLARWEREQLTGNSTL